MKALIVSYVDGITEDIENVIRKFDSDATIDKVKDTWSARYYLSKLQNSDKLYDIVVIDMMVQVDYNQIVDPILEPALNFIKLSKLDKMPFPKKLFALFDPDETDDRGKDEVRKLGFAVSDYKIMSMQWRDELYAYLAK